MPELPEVETVRRSLGHVAGRVVRAVSVPGPHAVSPPPPEFARRLRGRTLLRLGRHGKYLTIDLDGGDVLLCHLRMTGRLLYLPPRGRTDWPRRHIHVVLRLEGGGRLLFFDIRKFGRMWLVPAAELASALPAGRDALALRPADLRFAGRRAPVKSLLMDQRLIAGLGNIYADEALFRAGIDPRRPGGSLRPRERGRLAGAIAAVLDDALSMGGTTFLDYRDGAGRPGGFAQRLNVYGRGGEPCRACGMALQSARLGGRTTVWCPTCQV